jgi:hypothetical protein
MSAREYAAWQAFDAVEPIGGERLDLAAGIVAAAVANAARDPRRSKPFFPADFMPLAPKPPPPADGGLAAFIAWAKQHNARVRQTTHG